MKKENVLSSDGTLNVSPSQSQSVNTASSQTEVSSDFSKLADESKAALAQADAPKKRGRPKGWKKPAEQAQEPAPAQEPVKVEIPDEMLAVVLKTPYAAMADKTGYAGMEITDAESMALAKATNAVMARYLPAISSNHPELAALIITVGLITVPRMVGLSQHRRREREQKQAA